MPRLTQEPLVVCCSGMNVAEKDKIRQSVASIGQYCDFYGTREFSAYFHCVLLNYRRNICQQLETFLYSSSDVFGYCHRKGMHVLVKR